MSYTKTNWQDLPSENTPITANRLNNIENGIANSDGAIDVDEYSNSSTYAIGDYCIYNNKLYRCIVAITTSEAFNNSKWQQTRILDEVGTIDEDLENATKGYQETEFIKDLEITDSAGVNGKIKLVGGNTEQDSYEGKNLFNLYGNLTKGSLSTNDGLVTPRTLDTMTISNETITIGNAQSNYTGCITDYYEFNENTAYTCNGNISNSNGQILICFYNENKTYISNIVILEYGNEIGNFTTPANTKYVRISLRIKTNLTTLVTFSNIQILKGNYTSSTIPAYEPYVGGTPSPNPDYPQKVNNVGSNINLFDEIFQQGGLDFGSTGSETSSSNRIRTDYIEVQPNTTYTISSGNSNLDSFGLGLYKSDNSYDSLHKINAGGWNNFPYKFTTQSDTKYIRVAFRKSDNTDITPSGDYKIKLEEGSQPTGYTPYNRGGIDVKVENKNLFDEFYRTTDDNQYGYKEGNKYVSLSRTGSAVWVFKLNVENLSNLYLSFKNLTSGAEFKFLVSDTDVSTSSDITSLLSNIGNTITENRQITHNKKYLYMYFRISSGQTQASVEDIQIEESSSASSYIAHAEQNITIPLPEGMELCRSKDGQYLDNLFHNIPSNPMYNASLVEGAWYKYNAIYEKIVNENDSLTRVGSNSNENFSQINMNTDIPVPVVVESYSDYFSYLPTASSATVDKTQAGFCLRNQSLPYIVFSVPASISTTANVFRTWLTTHNVKIKYPLATPTYTQITDTDTIEALYKIEHLLMYEKYTHIYTDDEVQAYLQLDYLYDNEVNNTFGSIIDALEERVHLLEINS